MFPVPGPIVPPHPHPMVWSPSRLYCSSSSGIGSGSGSGSGGSSSISGYNSRNSNKSSINITIINSSQYFFCYYNYYYFYKQLPLLDPYDHRLITIYSLLFTTTITASPIEIEAISPPPYYRERGYSIIYLSFCYIYYQYFD